MPEDLGPAFFAYEDLTVAGSAVGFTAATYTRNGTVARTARAYVEVAAIRFRVDGGTPSATVGEPVEVGGVIELNSPDQVSSFRAFRRDGVSATLRSQFGR